MIEPKKWTLRSCILCVEKFKVERVELHNWTYRLWIAQNKGPSRRIQLKLKHIIIYYALYILFYKMPQSQSLILTLLRSGRIRSKFFSRSSLPKSGIGKYPAPPLAMYNPKKEKPWRHKYIYILSEKERGEEKWNFFFFFLKREGNGKQWNRLSHGYF